jgi:menaquinone-dependent protoporphyrinogen oxidase
MARAPMAPHRSAAKLSEDARPDVPPRHGSTAMTVLIAVATRHGATAEIAAAIATVLEERGVDVEVGKLGEVSDLAAYEAVIVGSAVYRGRWLDGARHFLRDHDAGLGERPVWLFSSGAIFGTPRSHHLGWTRAVDDVAATTPAMEHRFFGGKLASGTLGPIGRLLARAVGMREGDYRDFDEVRAWASSIADALESSDRSSLLSRTAAHPAMAGPVPSDVADQRRASAIAWLLWMVGVWAAFFGLLVQGRLDDVFGWLHDLPVVAEVAAWIVLLPWMLGMLVWNSSWPGFVRLGLVAAFAAFWILTARSAAGASVPIAGGPGRLGGNPPSPTGHHHGTS